ncbi:ATP-binding protein [Sphingomonas sp.]|uniref:ATP-binding protein n=1 Tax=Sphingomonas sp. TaxID=28214 RepID=UPI0025E53937|nr:ATP-binding protein [Sphingomonas sp.]MBV9528729.1 response regulator [Sphingomonas sp.]
MTARERSQINWRSAPIAIFAFALLILLGGIGVSVQFNSAYNRARIEQTQGFADVLAASTAAAVDFDDPAAAQDAANAYRVNKQIRLIAIFDRTGKAIAGYQRTGAPIPRSIEALPTADESEIRVSSPIAQAGQHVGMVYLDIDKDLKSRTFARYGIMLGLFLLAALVVATVGLAQVQLRRANRALKSRAEDLGRANDLLEEQMEERAKAEEQLRQSQKMQALGQLTGGIAHDFNNLLTVIQGSADMLCRPELPEAKRARFAQAIVQAATNAASLTSQLLAFARRQPLMPERIDVNALIADMRELIEGTVGERIALQIELGNKPCAVKADRAQLQSAVLNIASNARDAMDGRGTLTIRTGTVRNAAGDSMVAIEIADTGTGMDAETVDRIFEPFFTTKGTGKGTGLGLSQVYGFASQSGGDVRVDSAPGRGTRLTLTLACAGDEEPVDAGARPPEFANQPAVSILVVEDNEEVGAFAETLLSELGHLVTRAASGEEALDLARARKFDIVLSDVVMPGMGGLKLAQVLAEEQPRLPVVLATGYSQEIARSGSGGRAVILKPYRLATLSETLATALQSPQ